MYISQWENTVPVPRGARAETYYSFFPLGITTASFSSLGYCFFFFLLPLRSYRFFSLPHSPVPSFLFVLASLPYPTITTIVLTTNITSFLSFNLILDFLLEPFVFHLDSFDGLTFYILFNLMSSHFLIDIGEIKKQTFQKTTSYQFNIFIPTLWKKNGKTPERHRKYVEKSLFHLSRMKIKLWKPQKPSEKVMKDFFPTPHFLHHVQSAQTDDVSCNKYIEWWNLFQRS